MKAWILTGITIICAVLALAMHCRGQTVVVANDAGYRDDSGWTQSAQQVFISGGRGAHWGRWLTIVRDPATKEYGFLPSATFIFSRSKPIIKQLPKGYWGITFTENL